MVREPPGRSAALRGARRPLRAPERAAQQAPGFCWQNAEPRPAPPLPEPEPDPEPEPELEPPELLDPPEALDPPVPVLPAVPVFPPDAAAPPLELEPVLPVLPVLPVEPADELGVEVVDEDELVVVLVTAGAALAEAPVGTVRGGAPVVSVVAEPLLPHAASTRPRRNAITRRASGRNRPDIASTLRRRAGPSACRNADSR